MNRFILNNLKLNLIEFARFPYRNKGSEGVIRL